MSNVIQLSKVQGFTRMENDLYEALIGAELSGRELRVALAIHRLTAGYNSSTVKVAALYIAKMLYGDSDKAEQERANVSRAINSLIRQRVLFREGGSRDPIGFAPVSEWKLDHKSTVLKSTHCVENIPSTVLKTTHCVENIPSTVLKTTHIKDSKEIQVPTVLVVAERQPDQQAGISANPIRQKAAQNACPHQAIVDLYHEVLPELPGVALLNDTRKRHLQSRWREHSAHQSLDFWREYFESVKSSAFLMGRVPGRNGGKPFRATFDWLIAPSNFVKVVEGNYHA